MESKSESSEGRAITGVSMLGSEDTGLMQVNSRNDPSPFLCWRRCRISSSFTIIAAKLGRFGGSWCQHCFSKLYQAILTLASLHVLSDSDLTRIKPMSRFIPNLFTRRLTLSCEKDSSQRKLASSLPSLWSGQCPWPLGTSNAALPRITAHLLLWENW